MWPLEINFTFTERIYFVRTVLITFILGIAVNSFLALKLGFLLCLFCFGLVALLYSPKQMKYQKWIVGLSLIGFFCGSFLGGHAFNILRKQNDILKTFSSRLVTISGKMIDKEDSRKGQYITLSPNRIDNTPWPYSITKICFYANDFENTPLGSILEIKGNFLTGERVNLNCSGYLSNPITLSQEIFKPKSLANSLMRVRQTIHACLARHIREPFLSLAQGYILGDDKVTDPEVKDVLERTSMTHIVAVSGFNIAILFLMVKRLFTALHFSPRLAYFSALLVNVLFVLLAGNPASAIRAGIMLSLILGAERLERMGNFLNILLLTAFIMVLSNPLILIYDLGFQLSFLACWGLLFRQILKPRKLVPDPSFIRTIKSNLQETFWDSLFVLLFVSPLLVWNGGELSFKPLLANLPILPLVPLTTFFVIALLFVSPIFGSVANLLGLAIESIIAFQISILKFIASLNFLSQRVPTPAPTWIILYYFLLGALIHFKLKATRAII